MTLSKRLTAAALALPLAVAGAGCTPSPEEMAAAQQTLDAHGIREIHFPRKELQNLNPGAYEITIQTSKGPRDCIASVNDEAGVLRNSIVLDCK